MVWSRETNVAIIEDVEPLEWTDEDRKALIAAMDVPPALERYYD